MNSSNASCALTWEGLLSARCRPGWPTPVCNAANAAGLLSAAVWFFNLVPQVWKSFRARSVAGVSLHWALINFTAALNNSFFVFKLLCLPLYSYISAVYMPVLEAILLVEFFVFTPQSRLKLGLFGAFGLVWAALFVVQLSLDVYRQLEWLSVTLWSIETFPQIWLNMRRRSTKGLSNAMVALTTVGKTSDFLCTYLLAMPLQYQVMAFYSSTVAIFGTLQVLWYWGREPEGEVVSAEEEEEAMDNDGGDFATHSPALSATLRYLALAALSGELLGFSAALWWGTGSVGWGVGGPLSVLALLVGPYFLLRSDLFRHNFLSA